MFRALKGVGVPRDVTQPTQCYFALLGFQVMRWQRQHVKEQGDGNLGALCAVIEYPTTAKEMGGLKSYRAQETQESRFCLSYLFYSWGLGMPKISLPNSSVKDC